MEQLPVSLTLKDKKVVVTGNGTSAVRKADLALRAGAHVLLVAMERGPEFSELDAYPNLRIRLGTPNGNDFICAFAVFACSEDDAEDRSVRRLAKSQGAFVNVPDRPELCDFSIPAMLDRSPLMIAISSAGASPLLARLIKERLESVIPAEFGQLARFLGSIRDQVADRIPDKTQRRRFLERLLDGQVATFVLAGDQARATKQLSHELDAESDSRSSVKGEVYLVGAGPGDPDLLTFRAMRLLQRSDVVVYDRLVGSSILNLVRRDAERIYVGKQRDNHELPQEEISQLLVTLANQGKRVLRLKGGDPFIFGRGGEEIEMLAEHGIPFQVVPGITAASGCASYAGIPLTHRDHAQACVFVTGHAKKDGQLTLDWVTLLQPRQTLAIYMGLAVLPKLMGEFLANGADPTMPVAVVDNGTRPNQKVVTGTIATILDLVTAEGLKGPSMIIIGTVVNLRTKLDWFKPSSSTSHASAIASQMMK